MKCYCPFLRLFGSQINEEDCVYINKQGWCEDIDVCPGNSDAWCTQRIELAEELINLSPHLILDFNLLTKGVIIKEGF